MKNKLIITNDGSHSIFNNKVNESYHSIHGAIVEAEHVFIKNGMLATKKKKINILEIGFGTGLNALLTTHKSKQKKIFVNYHAIEPYPIEKNQYSQLNFCDLIGIDTSILIKLHKSQWEKEQKIHDFFKLTKHKILLEKYIPKKKFDIIYFDAFSPIKQPELWEENIFKKVHDLLHSDGFLVTYCAKGSVKRIMQKAGFKIIVLDGPPGKRQMTRGNKN